MKRYAVSLVLFGVLGASAWAPAPPSPVHAVDQQSTGITTPDFVEGCPVGAERAQVFTAGRTGVLDQVSLVATRDPGNRPTLQVNIYTVADNRPTANLIGGGSYNGPGSADNQTFTDIPLSAPASVTQGQQYVLVFTAPSPCTGGRWEIWGNFASVDTYDRGFALYHYWNPYWETYDPFFMDFAFKTWVI